VTVLAGFLVSSSLTPRSTTVKLCVDALSSALIESLGNIVGAEHTSGKNLEAVLRRYIETDEASVHEMCEVVYKKSDDIEADAEEHGWTICAETPVSGKIAVFFVKER
jgi:hypothetical protein